MDKRSVVFGVKEVSCMNALLGESLFCTSISSRRVRWLEVVIRRAGTFYRSLLQIPGQRVSPGGYGFDCGSTLLA